MQSLVAEPDKTNRSVTAPDGDVLTIMRAGLEAPDHTTLSRRAQSLDVAAQNLPVKRPLHLIVDSTGLSMVRPG